MQSFARRAVLAVRWWFGVTYVLTAIGGVIACPIMLVNGNGGGVYMLVGALIIGWLGWAILPWHPRRRTSA